MGQLVGGYRVAYDPRPALTRLIGESREEAWKELWQELFHQGDVGEASYAAVPELVALESARGTTDWNTYALVAVIDLARDERPSNPPVPQWLEPDYGESIRALADLALVRLASTANPLDSRSMLSVIALAKGLRIHARLLVGFTDDELLEFLNQAT